jgi:hypothetical protein
LYTQKVELFSCGESLSSGEEMIGENGWGGQKPVSVDIQPIMDEKDI